MREHWEGIVVGRKTLDGGRRHVPAIAQSPSRHQEHLFLVRTRIYALFQAVPLPPEHANTAAAPPGGQGGGAPRARSRATCARHLGIPDWALYPVNFSA